MNKNKKILVTGATGFVGSHMVDFLIKKKITIFMLQNDIIYQNYSSQKIFIIK